MKRKMKKLSFRLSGAFLLCMLILSVTSCKDDTTVAPEGSDTPVPEGYIRLSATVGLEGMTTVQTRAVDPDVNGVESIRLYCFDANGLFITTVSTNFKPDPANGEGYILSGTFEANVPDYTHTVHIVANQSTDAFRDTDYLGKSEKDVMTGLTASSSTMVYWGRVEAGMKMENTTDPKEDETLQEAFDRIMARDEPNNCIHLVRNQARVQFSKIDEDENGNPYFSIDGFYVCNTNAFGTIAPYNPENGQFDWVTNSSNRNYITLPSDLVRASIPNDIYSYESFPEQYVFETENPLTDPVSVVVKGKNEDETEAKYYRILVQDESFTPILIKRNHSYDIHITGRLTPGYATLQEALEGTPVNNVLFTVSDEITALAGPNYTLSVEKTSYVLTKDSDEWKDNDTFSFTYSFSPAENKQDPNETITTDDVTVAWTGEQNVAAETVTNAMTRDEAEDKLTGTVTLTLLPLGDDAYHEGTLMIHAKRLIRRVKIITVKKQTFVPTWVSSYVWHETSGEAFTLMFTIPDDTPSELFPFDVTVTAPEMDVRSETGMRLDVVTKVSDPDRYGEDIYYKADYNADGTLKANVKPIGYKFIVPVTAPGRQRIYFYTTIAEQTADQVTIENPYFETMQIPYSFASGNNNQKHRSIVFTDMNQYKGVDADSEFEGVNYIIVPRKKNAKVDFSFKVVDYTDDPAGKDMALSMDDEFILYTTFLDRNEAMITDDQHFTFANEGNSETSGRFYGFWPKADSDLGTHEEHTIHMLTNRPNTENVVILRTNSRSTYSIRPDNTNNRYTGNNYRSASFELTNYRAFRFNAQVKPQEVSEEDSWAGKKPQEWTYEPGQQVDISFDVTSFLSKANADLGLQDTEVDPFGTAFKVYIDAPMITIDTARQKEKGIPANKFYEESPGRFVYVVNASRSDELSEASGWSSITRYWTTETYPGIGDANPVERKTLPFITNSISSAGTITISAQSDIVDFDEETWTVVDKPITGRIVFGNAEDNVPKGAFVSFERTRDNTRIGSLTIDDEGKFSLSLRTEYTYAWGGTEYINFYYQGPDGTYTLPSDTRMTLETLFRDHYDQGNGAGNPIKLVKQN